MHDPHRALLGRAAEWLAPLAADLVYVGGCAAGLLISDTGAAGIRPTFDVDAIVQVASYADYDRFATAFAPAASSRPWMTRSCADGGAAR